MTTVGPSHTRRPATAAPAPQAPKGEGGSAQRRRATLLSGLGVPLAAGLVVRYALAPLLSWPGDDQSWARVASAGVHHLPLYQRLNFPYPPVFGHALQILGVLLQHLGLPSSDFAAFSSGMNQGYSLYMTSPGFNVAFKTLIFAFDVATAFLVFGLVLELTQDRRRARRAFCWWFLNPIVIVESAVMGAFDVVAGFFILAAVYCALTKRNRMLGAALALGVLTKLSPAFVAPMLFAAALARGARSKATPHPLRRVVGDVALGGLLSSVIALLPELASNSIGTMIHATLSRQTTGAYFGGFSFFGLSSIRGFGWISTLTNAHIGYVRLAVYLLQGAIVVWSVVRAAKRPTARTILSGAIVLLSSILLIGPLTQPQYLLWVLPVLTAATAAYPGPRWPVWVMSAAPIVFIVGILGPYAPLGSMATFTGLLSPEEIAKHVDAWLQRSPGAWTYYASGHLTAPAVLATVVAELALVIYWRRPGHQASEPIEAQREKTVRSVAQTAEPVQEAAEPAREAAEPAREAAEPVVEKEMPPVGDKTAAGPLEPRVAHLTVAAVAVAVLGSSLAASALTAPSPEPNASLLSTATKGDKVVVRLSITPSVGQQAVRLVAFPTRPAPAIRDIYVYYDPAYPYAGTDQRTQLGMTDHVRAELSVRRSRVPVHVIGANGLASVLSNVSSAAGEAVVDTSGVLPASVLSDAAGDLVTPWLAHGGTMVWGGSPIGWYTATAGSGPLLHAPPSLGLRGTTAVLGPGFLAAFGQQPTQTALRATPFGSAMGVTYQSTSIGISTRAVQMRSGASLGWTGRGYSSLTTVPVGRGALISFAGSIYDEQDAAQDLVDILLSRGYALAGNVAYTELRVGQLRARGGTVEWRLDPTELRMIRGYRVRVVEIDPDPRGVMLESQSFVAGGDR